MYQEINRILTDIDGRGFWGVEQQNALQNLRSRSKTSKFAESLTTWNPTLAVLIKILNKRELDAESRLAAIVTLYNMVSNGSFRYPKAFFEVITADVVSVLHFIMLNETKDASLPKFAAMITVSILTASEDYDFDVDSDDEEIEYTDQYERNESKRSQATFQQNLKNLFYARPHLAAQCAQLLVSKLRAVLSEPALKYSGQMLGYSHTSNEEEIKDIVHVVSTMAASDRYASQLISKGALLILVRMIQRYGELLMFPVTSVETSAATEDSDLSDKPVVPNILDEVYWRVARALNDLMSEDDTLVDEFLKNEPLIDMLRAVVVGLIDADSEEKIHISRLSKAFSNYIIRRIGDGSQEAGAGRPGSVQPATAGQPDVLGQPAVSPALAPKEGQQAISMQTTVDASAGQHTAKYVMVSYALDEDNLKVDGFVKRLQQMGLQVWKDDDGTRLSTAAKVTDVVDMCYCVIFFISRSYCTKYKYKDEVCIPKIHLFSSSCLSVDY